MILILQTVIKKSSNSLHYINHVAIIRKSQRQRRNNMNMPKPIYESLPILYVIGGIAAISTVDSFMSFISGILLGCSGVMIMFLRRDYRDSEKSEI